MTTQSDIALRIMEHSTYGGFPKNSDETLEPTKIRIMRNIIKSCGYEIEGDLSKLFHSPINFASMQSDLEHANRIGDLSIFTIVEEEGRTPFYVLS